MFLLLIGCLANQLLFANAVGNQGIQFYNGTWEEVLSLAKSQNKPIFVEMSATWCMPCKKMQKYVFTQPDIGEYYNAHFINYIVDIDTEEGKRIKRRFNISSIPELFYFDSNGNMLIRETGMKNRDEMFSFAQRALDRTQPIVASRGAKRATSRLYDKVYDLKNNGLPYENVVNQYLFKQWISGRLKKQHNMTIVYEFSEDLNTKAIDYLIWHKKAFALKYGEQAVQTKIKSIVLSNVSIAAANKNTTMFKKIKKVIAKANLSDKDFAHRIDMVYYEGIQDKEQYVKVIKKYMRKYKGEDATIWHQKAWAVIQKSQKKSDLKLAKKWIAYSVTLDEEYYNLESLATIYAKLGRKRRASKVARKAIRTARRTGRTPSKAMNLLSQAN